jgi:RNA polymerase sigma-70 factor, ECF subfamily
VRPRRLDSGLALLIARILGPLPRSLSPGAPSCYASGVRVGSSSTFAKQVLEHVDALHSFAYRLTRNRSEAEDLVQETFTRAVAARATFRSDTNLRSWLFRILRNAHIDALRRARRAPLGHGNLEPELSSDDIASELLRGDIEVDRLRRIVADDIEAALFELNDEARRAILLDLEGFTEAEIAEVLGCAPGTVKSRLARARASLRLKLAEYAK